MINKAKTLLFPSHIQKIELRATVQIEKHLRNNPDLGDLYFHVFGNRVELFGSDPKTPIVEIPRASHFHTLFRRWDDAFGSSISRDSLLDLFDIEEPSPAVLAKIESQKELLRSKNPMMELSCEAPHHLLQKNR